MSKISEILLRFIESGYSPDDLKKVCLEVLTPFFKNKATIERFWTSNDLLTAFVFTVRYQNDEAFIYGLNEVLKCYRKSLEQNKELTLKIIGETLFRFSQKDNMMFTVQRNVESIESSNSYEYIMLLMNHIGQVLEIGTKHLVGELWAITRIENGIVPDYERICELDFGVVTQNILQTKRFENILKIEPPPIKISDWRNIAYHHNYYIAEENITCYYGKFGSSFSIDVEGLEKYVHMIVRSSNILSIAHNIIILENLDSFTNKNDSVCDASKVFIREDLLNESLRVSLLSQSFLLEKVELNAETASISIVDLLCTCVGDDNYNNRRIHSSQFLYEVWFFYSKRRVEVKYSTIQNRECFISSVDASVCEKIGCGEKDLSYLAEHVSFTIG